MVGRRLDEIHKSSEETKVDIFSVKIKTDPEKKLNQKEGRKEYMNEVSHLFHKDD